MSVRRSSVVMLVAVIVGWLASAPMFAEAEAAPVVIPEATAVRLRFAQAVVAPRFLFARLPAAHRGDKVRLVAAADVRVGDQAVIARGALAQATVTDVNDGVFAKNPELHLRFDWVETVTGARVRLRAARMGRATAFKVQVFVTEAGSVAGPSSLKASLTKGLSLKERADVPAGARTVAYLDGSVPLDASDVQEAQAKLPARSPNAVLTVYRLNGAADVLTAVSCDDKELGKLGEKQYVVAELPPGKHVVNAERGEALELVLAAGEEYFLRLKAHSDRSEIKLVDAGEGEDAVAISAAVEKR